MTDHEDDARDEPWGEGPDVPPLSDSKNPLAGRDGESDEDETREWVPPVP
jgi:hypothetical protein